jgi:hypothetical protein
MLLIAPGFAMLAFAVLCHVYKIAAVSHAALLMARATAASAGFYPLSLCAAMLSVSRRAGRFTIVPTVLGALAALVASALMFVERDSLWLLAAPAAATGVASSATMAWAAVRSGQRPTIAFVALLCSIGMVLVVSASLSSAGVELWLERGVQAALGVARSAVPSGKGEGPG